MDTHLSFYRAITAEADRGVEKHHDFKRVLQVLYLRVDFTFSVLIYSK